MDLEIAKGIIQDSGINLNVLKYELKKCHVVALKAGGYVFLVKAH